MPDLCSQSQFYDCVKHFRSLFGIGPRCKMLYSYLVSTLQCKSPWVFFALFLYCTHFLFCPPYKLKHIDLRVQHGSVCSIYAFAFIAINHRSLVCEVKFEIKCFPLRSNAFRFNNKSITNKCIKEKPKYVSILLFWLLPRTNKKNEADQHDPRRPCEKCKHLKLKLSGSSLAVELSLLLSSDSLSPLSSIEILALQCQISLHQHSHH